MNRRLGGIAVAKGASCHDASPDETLAQSNHGTGWVEKNVQHLEDSLTRDGCQWCQEGRLQDIWLQIIL